MRLGRPLSAKLKSSNELLSRFLESTDLSEAVITNPKLLQLYDNFHLHHKDTLPLTKPSFVQETPFQYHCMHNSDKSLMVSPRLSVTKLLISSWCQLRNYYEIYCGAIEQETTAAMAQGTRYHEQLELADFEEIDTEILESKLDELLSQDTVSSNSELAVDWGENIINKLFALITRSSGREILVHGYLDLKGSKLQLTDDSVLISGIIDQIRLVNPENEEDFTMFHEITSYVDLTFSSLQIDMEECLSAVREIISNYNYKMVITDVKTRSTNSVPGYASVLRAAYLQVAYYKQFVDSLSSDETLSYEMLLENARRRQCDLDAPISKRTVLLLVRKYPYLFLSDFTKLAEGKKIGFELFDNHEHSGPDFDMTDVFSNEDIRGLCELDAFDYEVFKPLLVKWSNPPTLRYFAARSAQFFHTIEPMASDQLTVEYHNAKTGFNFQTKHYTFRKEDLQKSIDEASSFWNDAKPPVPVTDLQKCTYCDFKTKCPIPNKNLKSFGVKLNQFIM